jgi:hypothetical protein
MHIVQEHHQQWAKQERALDRETAVLVSDCLQGQYRRTQSAISRSISHI